MKIVLKQPKPVNPVVRDLLTPKYRQRVVASKVVWSRKEKHKGATKHLNDL